MLCVQRLGWWRSSSQREGIDFFDAFPPCPTVTSIRMLAAVACHMGRDMCHHDAEHVFVQSTLDEDVFIRLPQGCGALSGKVVKLARSLYGLK